ncbi:MAG TPA: hypothetical protein VIN93_14550 [Bryobacteraceae bacterium]
MRSSNVRRIGATRQACDAAGIGMLPIPDPRHWPAEIRRWYRDAVGKCGPLDVFIFNSGQVGALYLQDAITAAAVCKVNVSEWHTERGFPAFIFDAGRVAEIQHQLDQCGYKTHIVETAGKRSSKQRRAPVVSIACARRRKQEAKAQ